MNTHKNSEDECVEDVKKIHSDLHTLVLASHVVFLIAGIYALYRKYFLLGAFILLETAVSFIYHMNETKRDFAKADSHIATLCCVMIMIVAIQKFRKIRKEKSHKSELHVLVVAMAFVVIGFCAYIYAIQSAPKGVRDDDIGLYSKSDSTDSPNKEKEEIMYLVYHVIWHITIGVAGIIVISI